ncbi:uncharacterized protein LOC130236664 [Danio aesculapii]|uniref:uncharacterized protein LOC130236664 n=1 Tax=Danio aesculapii TaxID=1142201 RepID=UPI0024BFDCEB|nr:uncharacterized protein LOC130236664 [Danio aesculapii]
MRFLKMHHNRLQNQRIFRCRVAEISENPRLQMEENETPPRRNTTECFSPAVSSSPAEHTALSSTEAQQTHAAPQKTPRRNTSIRAAHPAIYLNTRSHKLLRKAVRIWKRPFPIFTPQSSVSRVRSFQERVQMLQSQPAVSRSPQPLSRCVRDLQLRSSGTDSSPSPSSRSDQPPIRRRKRPAVIRSYRYRRQMQLYRMLSSCRRLKQEERILDTLKGQSSPAGCSPVKGSQGVDDGSDSASSPVIRPPPRKTNRRLWRRQLDSSSSDNSPITPNPFTTRPDTLKKNTSIALSDFASVLKTSLSSIETDVNSSEVVQKNSSTAQICEDTEEGHEKRPSSLVSRLKMFKEELRPCGEVRTSPVCVKWKSVLLQRALCSSPLSCESQSPDARSSWCRFTLLDCSTSAGKSDTDKPHVNTEYHIKNSMAGDY